MMMVAENIAGLKEELPENVRLVAVSKFHAPDLIMEAYNAGQRCFGESRVQELLDKERILPGDIEWHFIGHLQTNKVRKLVGKTSMIESIDSERLLRLVDDESARAGVVSHVLMQVHVASEDTKFGFSPEELLEFFSNRGFESLKATHIHGIMGMASNTCDEDRIRKDFETIHNIYRQIADDATLGLSGFDTLSMGMSGDWRLAVEVGSTSVRIGSAIFGQRQY